MEGVELRDQVSRDGTDESFLVGRFVVGASDLRSLIPVSFLSRMRQVPRQIMDEAKRLPRTPVPVQRFFSALWSGRLFTLAEHSIQLIDFST